MDQQKPKLNIEQNQEDLKIFIFTIQRGIVNVEVPEDFQAVIGYNDNDALNVIRQSYQPGMPIMVKKRAAMPIRKILDAVNLESSQPVLTEIQFLTEPPKEIDKNVNKFLYSLSIVADTYVKDARDRVALRRIINKIKPHEATPTATTEENAH